MMSNGGYKREEVYWKIYLQQLAGVLVRFFAVWFVLLYMAVSGLLGAWFTFEFLFAP